MISFISIPVGALVAALTIGFLSSKVCRYGDGFCSDNIIPGAVIGLVLFGFGHILAGVLIYLISRWRVLGTPLQILIGIIVVGILPMALAAMQRDPVPNLALAFAALISWSVIFGAERLIDTRLGSTIK